MFARTSRTRASLAGTSLVRTAQVSCACITAVLAATVPAAPAAAATFNVACSEGALVAAINAANGTTASDTLNLSPHCTYALTGELPAITSTIEINGANATLGPSSGAFRILTVNGGDLTLRSTVVEGGNAAGSPVATGAGGGIVVTGNGALTLTSSVVRSNLANFGGGLSVFTGSRAVVRASTISDNTANNNGGGIVSDGTVSVTASRITDNRAGNAGGGIASIGTLTVTSTNIADNDAGIGAGVANGVPGIPQGTAALTATTITGNTATAAPGGLYNNNPAAGAVRLTATRITGNLPSNCTGSPVLVTGCAN
ncbi:hypothetical protein ABZ446_38870 [Streptomyces sp. NPDC005813]|uniref:hypothetical protein n=1 Tax=Streptomyces sp. NPDC005813 TaxID=3155592 RepID=UPI00340B413B